MYNIEALSMSFRDNPEWFTRALFGGRLIRGGYLRAVTGVKGGERLNQIDLTGKLLQKDGLDCAWTPKQVIRLSEQVAEIKTYKINLEQCIDELERKRLAWDLAPGAQNTELPADLRDATLYLLSVELSNEIETMLIGGDESVNPDDINGMVSLLRASTDTIKLTGVALTVANVLGEVGKVYAAIPEDVLRNERAGTLRLFVSYRTVRLIQMALAEKNNQVLFEAWSRDNTDPLNPIYRYFGMEIVPVLGMGDDTMVAIDSRNAYLLTDLMSDLERIEIGNFPAPWDNKVYVRGRLRLGFVIPFPDEAVLYSTDTEGIFVTPNDITFDKAGGLQELTVTAPSAYTEATTGTGGSVSTLGGKLFLTVAENTGAAREGTVTFTLTSSGDTATVTWKQAAGN